MSNSYHFIFVDHVFVSCLELTGLITPIATTFWIHCQGDAGYSKQEWKSASATLSFDNKNLCLHIAEMVEPPY